MSTIPVAETKLFLMFHALKRIGIFSVSQQALNIHNSDKTPEEKVSHISKIIGKSLVQWNKIATNDLDDHWLKIRLNYQPLQEESLKRALKWEDHTILPQLVKTQATTLLEMLDRLEIKPFRPPHHSALEDIQNHLNEYTQMMIKEDLSIELETSPVDPLSTFSLFAFEEILEQTKQRYSLSQRMNLFAQHITGDSDASLSFKYSTLSPEQKQHELINCHPNDPSSLKLTLLYAQEFGRIPHSAGFLSFSEGKTNQTSSMDDLSEQMNTLINKINPTPSQDPLLASPEGSVPELQVSTLVQRLKSLPFFGKPVAVKKAPAP